MGNELEALTDELFLRAMLFAGLGGVLSLATRGLFLSCRVMLVAGSEGKDVVQVFLENALWLGPAIFILSLLAWLWLGRWLWKAMQRQVELRLGWRGETAVGEALSHRRVMNVALAVFHDIPGDGPWNIDHVVVTRAGLFLIETKTRTKRTGRNSADPETVECVGDVIRFPYWNDEATVPQADRNARWMRRFMGPLTPPDYPIQAVIALPGWNVQNGDRLKIPAKRANDLIAYIGREAAEAQKAFDEADLRKLIKALDDRCRTVDF